MVQSDSSPFLNNHNHEIHGRLEIVKNAMDPDDLSLVSTGQLKIVDLDEALIHFDFEDIFDMKRRPGKYHLRYFFKVLFYKYCIILIKFNMCCMWYV